VESGFRFGIPFIISFVRKLYPPISQSSCSQGTCLDAHVYKRFILRFSIVIFYFSQVYRNITFIV